MERRQLLQAVLALVVLAGCESRPDPKQQAGPQIDRSAQRAKLAELEGANRQAWEHFRKHERTAAGDIVGRTDALSNNLIGGDPAPSIEIMRAVSDHDELYGRLLMANRHWGHARHIIAKIENRWRLWQPQDDESRKRRQAAIELMRECDRNL